MLKINNFIVNGLLSSVLLFSCTSTERFVKKSPPSSDDTQVQTSDSQPAQNAENMQSNQSTQNTQQPDCIPAKPTTTTKNTPPVKKSVPASSNKKVQPNNNSTKPADTAPKKDSDWNLLL